jgi:hypothetical protein
MFKGEHMFKYFNAIGQDKTLDPSCMSQSYFTLTDKELKVLYEENDTLRGNSLNLVFKREGCYVLCSKTLHYYEPFLRQKNETGKGLTTLCVKKPIQSHDTLNDLNVKRETFFDALHYVTTKYLSGKIIYKKLGVNFIKQKNGKKLLNLAQFKISKKKDFNITGSAVVIAPIELIMFMNEVVKDVLGKNEIFIDLNNASLLEKLTEREQTSLLRSEFNVMEMFMSIMTSEQSGICQVKFDEFLNDCSIEYNQTFHYGSVYPA